MGQKTDVPFVLTVYDLTRSPPLECLEQANLTADHVFQSLTVCIPPYFIMEYLVSKTRKFAVNKMSI